MAFSIVFYSSASFSQPNIPSIPDSVYFHDEFSIWFREGTLNKNFLGCDDNPDDDLIGNAHPFVFLPLDTSFIRSQALVEFLTSIGVNEIHRASNLFIPCRDTLSITRWNDTIRMPDVWNIIKFKLSTDTMNIPSICYYLTVFFQRELNFAEPSFKVIPASSGDRKNKIRNVPNDPRFQDQLSIQDNLSSGSFVESAWNFNTGSYNIKVAIIDDGAFYFHEDFGNQQTFPSSGDKFSEGYNYTSNPVQPIWNSRHGTAMAGIIGAITNNNLGIAGISGGFGGGDIGLQMKIFKFMKSAVGGVGASPDLAIAIFESSADNPSQTPQQIRAYSCNILNMSLDTYAGGLLSETERRAIAFSFQNGAVNIVAMGNHGDDNRYGTYPADYPPYWMINVGAHDQSKTNRRNDSNYGDNIDLVAPGFEDHIITTEVGSNSLDISNYTNTVGQTSAATAHVSGVAGLILTEHRKNKKYLPPYLSPEDVEGILNYSTDDIIGTGQGWDRETGFGTLNAKQALELMNQQWEIDHFAEELFEVQLDPIDETSPDQVIRTSSHPNSYTTGYFLNYVERKNIRTRVNYPRVGGYREIKGVWGRGSELIPSSAKNNKKIGWTPIEWGPSSRALALYSDVGYTKVIDWDLLGCTLETHIYHVWERNPDGSKGSTDLGWFPINPNQTGKRLVLPYTVVGIPNIPTEIRRVPEVSSAIGFSITTNYPNPFITNSKVRVYVVSESNLSVYIINTLGIKIKNLFENVRFEKGTYEFSVSFSDLPGGIYTMIATDGNSIKAIKLNHIK